MKNKFSTSLALILGSLVLALSSCSKDKDLDDYRNEKLQADLAEFKEVEGAYSGYLISKEDKNLNLGALKITLTATTQTVNTNDSSRAIAQPILLADIKYRGNYESSIVGKNSVYEPNTGHFHTEIEIPIVNETGRDVNETIMIEGSVGGGVLVGSMYVASASGSGGEFELRQDNGSLQDLVRQRKPDIISSREVIQKEYLGYGMISEVGGEKPKDSKPKKVEVRLNVGQPVRTKFDEIYYILKPITESYFIANFSLGEGRVGTAFPYMIWNAANGTLRGTTSLVYQATTITISLSCNDFHFEDKNYNFKCSYLSSMLGKPIELNFSDKQK